MENYICEEKAKTSFNNKNVSVPRAHVSFTGAIDFFKKGNVERKSIILC